MGVVRLADYTGGGGVRERRRVSILLGVKPIRPEWILGWTPPE